MIQLVLSLLYLGQKYMYVLHKLFETCALSKQLHLWIFGFSESVCALLFHKAALRAAHDILQEWNGHLQMSGFVHWGRTSVGIL